MANQDANTFYAGPTGGSPAEPTFRDMVFADIPASVLASIVAHVSCQIGENFPQWLEFALSPFKAGTTTYASTGTWVDRPPGFEFVSDMLPRASRITNSGLVTIDIKFGSAGGVGGSSIFSTKLTIADGQRSSEDSTPCVLTTTTHTDDTEMSIIVENAGTNTEGLLVRMPIYWTIFS